MQDYLTRIFVIKLLLIPKHKDEYAQGNEGESSKNVSENGSKLREAKTDCKPEKTQTQSNKRTPQQSALKVFIVEGAWSVRVWEVKISLLVILRKTKSLACKETIGAWVNTNAILSLLLSYFKIVGIAWINKLTRLAFCSLSIGIESKEGLVEAV